MYKSQKEEDDCIRASKMTAVLKSNGNLSELQQKVEEAADIAVADSKKTPKPESGKNKQILDKDDAYWDTLSTIASTRGMEEKFAPTKAAPGPIPIEITAVNDKPEEKEATTPKSKKKKTKAKNKPKTPETMGLTKQSSDTTRVAKEETTTVAEEEPVNEKVPTPEASTKKLERSKVDADGKTGLEVTAPTCNENMNSINAMPESSTPKHKNDQNNFVSWGNEQIHKEPSNRRGSAYGAEPHIEEDVPPLDYKEEQELLTRTLQLSKDLLASLTNDVDQPTAASRRDVPVETEPMFQDNYTFSSNEDFPIDVEKLIAEHGYGNDIDQEEVIPAPMTYNKKSHHDREMIDDSFRGPRTPQILSKLDVLRAQRAQALARFHDSKKNFTGEVSVNPLEPYESEPMVSSVPEVQRRDPVKFFQPSTASPIVGQHQLMRIEEREEIESEASTTPSKKAKDLRRQLDEALLASREIRRSQEKLGTELQTFKSRFTQRNGEIEDQALRAMSTTAGMRHADI